MYKHDNRPCYTYEGAISQFGRIAVSNWKALTYAISEKQARSNFQFQAKRLLSLAPQSKIELPGRLVKAVPKA